MSKVQHRIEELERRLKEAHWELESHRPSSSQSPPISNKELPAFHNHRQNKTISSFSAPEMGGGMAGHPGKRGYLFKWRDRSIGWGTFCSYRSWIIWMFSWMYLILKY